VLSHARTYDALESAVEAVRLVRDRETNKGKGIGFVLFKSKEAARAALNLNGEKIKERAVRHPHPRSFSRGGGTFRSHSLLLIELQIHSKGTELRTYVLVWENS